jgi:hypothetical protein
MINLHTVFFSVLEVNNVVDIMRSILFFAKYPDFILDKAILRIHGHVLVGKTCDTPARSVAPGTSVM